MSPLLSMTLSVSSLTSMVRTCKPFAIWITWLSEISREPDGAWKKVKNMAITATIMRRYTKLFLSHWLFIGHLLSARESRGLVSSYRKVKRKAKPFAAR